MPKSEVEKKEKKIHAYNKKFSEVNELNHEHNQVAKAQKQIASQETTGILDQE